MSVSKVALKNKFYAFCQLIGVPCGIEQAEKMNAEYFATLDYDRTNGGYLPVMVRIATRSHYGFMRGSTSDKRLPLNKMFDKVCEWCETAVFIKENGFPALNAGFENSTILEKSDTITIHARRYFSGSNTYHCVRVYVNGSIIGETNNEYGYEDAYRQTAIHLLGNAGYYIGSSLRAIRANILYCVSDVRNKKDAQF